MVEEAPKKWTWKTIKKEIRQKIKEKTEGGEEREREHTLRRKWSAGIVWRENGGRREWT